MKQTLEQIIEALKLLTRDREAAQPQDDRVVALNSVLSLIGTFEYEPQHNVTFTRWFSRNEPFQNTHCCSDVERAQLVLKALGAKEYNQLRGRTSPNLPESKAYPDLVNLLKEMFGDSKSLFRRRHDTLLVVRHAPGKLTEGIINSTKLSGDDFEFNNLTMENFHISIMLLQLSDPSYKNLRAIIMRAVDDKPGITLEELRTVMKRYKTRVDDTRITGGAQRQGTVMFNTNSSRRTQKFQKRKKGGQNHQSSKSQKSICCSGCGEAHFRRDCRFKDAVCNLCKNTGHIAKVCRSVQSNVVQINHMLNWDQLREGRTFITIDVNNRPLVFRADSGADISTIDVESWKILGAPRLTKYAHSCSHVDGGEIMVKGFFEARFGFKGKTVTELNPSWCSREANRISFVAAS